MLAYILEEY